MFVDSFFFFFLNRREKKPQEREFIFSSHLFNKENSAGFFSPSDVEFQLFTLTKMMASPTRSHHSPTVSRVTTLIPNTTVVSPRSPSNRSQLEESISSLQSKTRRCAHLFEVEEEEEGFSPHPWPLSFPSNILSFLHVERTMKKSFRPDSCPCLTRQSSLSGSVISTSFPVDKSPRGFLLSPCPFSSFDQSFRRTRKRSEENFYQMGEHLPLAARSAVSRQRSVRRFQRRSETDRPARSSFRAKSSE